MTLSASSSPPRALKASDVAAALSWWREAGVDQDFSDAARDWLEANAPAVTEAAAAAPEPFVLPPAPAPPPLGGMREDWPQELATFNAWWLTEPLLDAGQVFGRVAPRGPQNAPLMVLVDHPEVTDSQTLLAGEQGRLVHAILSALGIALDQAYIASLLPRHMPMPDWPALAAAGLGEIALHHIALAAPSRVISFGANVSSLLGHDPAKSADPLQQFYHVGSSIPALAAPGLTTLMARPRGKAALWQALLNWQQG